MSKTVVTTSEAARRLGVTASTVRNMLSDGRLSGERGGQLTRKRWFIHLDSEGRLIDNSGVAVPEQDSTQAAIRAELDEIRGRIQALENSHKVSAKAGSAENLREAALLLSATLEHQREAAHLISEANRKLSEALAEQGRIITTLLIPDSEEILER